MKSLGGEPQQLGDYGHLLDLFAGLIKKATTQNLA